MEQVVRFPDTIPERRAAFRRSIASERAAAKHRATAEAKQVKAELTASNRDERAAFIRFLKALPATRRAAYRKLQTRERELQTELASGALHDQRYPLKGNKTFPRGARLGAVRSGASEPMYLLGRTGTCGLYRNNDNYGVSHDFTYQYQIKNGALHRKRVYEGYFAKQYHSNDEQSWVYVRLPPSAVAIVVIKKRRAKAQAALKRVQTQMRRVSKAFDKWRGAERRRIEARVVKLEAAAKNPRAPEAERLERELAAFEQNVAGKDLLRVPLPKNRMSEFVKLTQGLGYRDLLNLFLMMHGSGKPLEREAILTYRQEILVRAYGDLLEIVEPAYGFDGIAGLENVKKFFTAVRDAILEGDLRRAPMRALLMGPPGTGKTAVGEAFARECGFLFVKFKNVRDMFVGQSEKRQEQALQAIRDLAPVVVLRDEVDEEDSGRDTYQGDSGVSARLRRAWMQLLSDPTIRGKVFVISCTNRPDRLDAALKRSGRTDERIPLFMPDAATREALFPVMVRRYGFPCSIKKWKPYARLSDGLSGADIEVIVRRSFENARERGKQAIDDRAVRAAIKDFIPAASEQMIATMTYHALRETSSRRYLPEHADRLLREARRAMNGSN